MWTKRAEAKGPGLALSAAAEEMDNPCIPLPRRHTRCRDRVVSTARPRVTAQPGRDWRCTACRTPPDLGARHDGPRAVVTVITDIETIEQSTQDLQVEAMPDGTRPTGYAFNHMQVQ